MKTIKYLPIVFILLFTQACNYPSFRPAQTETQPPSLALSLTPTPTLTLTPTPTRIFIYAPFVMQDSTPPAPDINLNPTSTFTPTLTTTPTMTSSPSLSPTRTLTRTPTPPGFTHTSTSTQNMTFTPTPTETNTLLPPDTSTPTPTNTLEPTDTPTVTQLPPPPTPSIDNSDVEGATVVEHPEIFYFSYTEDPSYLLRIFVHRIDLGTDDGDENDGDGIANVRFELKENVSGNTVLDQSDNSPGFCIFGGGSPNCNSWVLEENVYKWSPGGIPIVSGEYRLQVYIYPVTPIEGLNEFVDWIAVYQITVP